MNLNCDKTKKLFTIYTIHNSAHKLTGFVTIQIRARSAKHDALKSLPDRRKDAAKKATNEAPSFLILNS